MTFRYSAIVRLGAGISLGISVALTHWRLNEVSALDVPRNTFQCIGETCPLTRWDSNWDLRSGVINKITHNDVKYDRNIILIRHAQYQFSKNTDHDRKLTEVGIKQTRALASRLKLLNLPYRGLYCSTLIRAVQTAKILQKELSLKLDYNSMINEGIPAHAIPSLAGWEWDDQILYRDSQRVEAAFRNFFYTVGNPVGPTFELIVCHANVIRFFLCRALQVPPEAWLRFSIPHCSMTWITIHGNGTVSVRCVGEHTFLPDTMVTY